MKDAIRSVNRGAGTARQSKPVDVLAIARQMEESEPALDCHVVLMADAWSRMEDIKSQIKRRLEDQFDISHSSLEFEHEHRQHQNADLYGHGRSEDRNAAQFSGP